MKLEFLFRRAKFQPQLPRVVAHLAAFPPGGFPCAVDFDDFRTDHLAFGFEQGDLGWSDERFAIPCDRVKQSTVLPGEGDRRFSRGRGHMVFRSRRHRELAANQYPEQESRTATGQRVIAGIWRAGFLPIFPAEFGNR